MALAPLIIIIAIECNHIPRIWAPIARVLVYYHLGFAILGTLAHTVLSATVAATGSNGCLSLSSSVIHILGWSCVSGTDYDALSTGLGIRINDTQGMPTCQAFEILLGVVSSDACGVPSRFAVGLVSRPASVSDMLAVMQRHGRRGISDRDLASSRAREWLMMITIVFRGRDSDLQYLPSLDLKLPWECISPVCKNPPLVL